MVISCIHSAHALLVICVVLSLQGLTAPRCEPGPPDNVCTRTPPRKDTFVTTGVYLVFKVIKTHTVGSLLIPRASIEWV